MDIVGHRGACGHAPENTLRSFAKAIALGCQRVELDIHLSADRVPVVIHDQTVDRTTNGKGAVRELTLAQLKSLEAGEKESIPTLLEVMDLCRGRAELQIELKEPDSPPPVAGLIREYWEPEKAVITSFQLSLLDAFAALMPHIPRGLLNRDPNLDMIALARRHRHLWICPRFSIVSEDLVGRAHEARLLLYVYHVNDRDLARELIRWGADALGTDYPEMVFGVLSALEKPMP